jgi:hypothetical protein
LNDRLRELEKKIAQLNSLENQVEKVEGEEWVIQGSN